MYRRLIVFSAILFFSLYCLTAFSLTETKKETKWELVWEENFNGNKLDTTVWRYMERGKDDSRKYHSSNPLCYDFKKGKLILKGTLKNCRTDGNRLGKILSFKIIQFTRHI